MLKLFAVQLGGRADGCNTELHDTVFVIGESLESTYPQLVKKWFGNKQRLHIDSSVELTYADGYNISVSKEKPRESTGLNLYFVNFGAYKTNFFGEIHQVNFYVAEKKSAAVKKHECVAMLVKDLRPPWCKSTPIARQLISRDRPRHAQLRYLRITSYRVLK